MKVVQILPGKVWGGAEQYVLDLGNSLIDRGHDVTFICRNALPVTSRLTDSGTPFTALAFSWAFDRRSIKDLAEIIKDADIIHIHDIMFAPIALLAARRSGSKARIVMTRHDAHRTPVNPFYRRFVRDVDHLIFVSDLARRSWLGANRWFPPEKCSVVINSTPPAPAIPMESLREKFGIDSSTPLLLFCGRIKKTKGCDVMLEALSRLRDRNFALVMIGACNKESFRRRLDEIAQKGGIADRVHYYGFSDRGRLFFPQADIALAPSSGKDACPLSNIEAMQAGVCVITTSNGGQAEYITDHVTGLLVPPADSQALADAIAEVIDDASLRKRLADAGHRYFIAEMTFDKFTDRIEAIYRNESSISSTALHRHI